MKALLVRSGQWCLLLLTGLLFALPLQAQENPIDSLIADSVIQPIPVLQLDLLEASLPDIMRVGKGYEISLQHSDPGFSGSFPVLIQGEKQNLQFSDGTAQFSFSPKKGEGALELGIPDSPENKRSFESAIVNFPPWMSLLPPLIAIVLALLIQEVILSLFVGVMIGAIILAVSVQGGGGIVGGFLAVIDTYVLHALADEDHASIIVFSMLIGGIVALISRNGGMQGMVNGIAKRAKTARDGQFATWFLGLAIFFDDYANTLVVGNTMRAVTDRLRVSREKLSYLVDSTAAPVAALAFITTWIGAELGYIADGIGGLEGFPEGLSAYGIFLSSLKYAFYPILTLIFMVMLIWTGRDYGPMLKAERRARETGAVTAQETDPEGASEVDHFQPAPGIAHRAFNAWFPIAVLVFGVLIGLIYTGYDAAEWNKPGQGLSLRISTMIGNANSYAALLWASLGALAVALIMTLSQRLLSLVKAMEAVTQGFKAMLGAIIILSLAWSLQGVTDDMHTAQFLTDLLGNALNPGWIPALTFVLAALVSFATGSSWGTMAILYPLIIPLAWEVGLQSGWEEAAVLPILYNAVASVLAGSVLGDHCSPISDTTILSSLACSCDHLDHVRTQLPYAITVGLVALLIGNLPTAFGLPTWISYVLGLGALFAVVRFVGKEVETAS
ncbi:MAG: Na+/H+ antiporter NhaC family protein [Bacteroidota bacterium]